jgi:hypothetical protein
MNQIEIKNKYDNKLLFKASQIGFALNADLAFTSRIAEMKNDVR